MTKEMQIHSRQGITHKNACCDQARFLAQCLDTSPARKLHQLQSKHLLSSGSSFPKVSLDARKRDKNLRMNGLNGETKEQSNMPFTNPIYKK